MQAKLMGERGRRRIFLHEVPSLLGSSLLPPDVYDVIILSYGARVARHHHCRISQPFNRPRKEKTQLIEHPSAKTCLANHHWQEYLKLYQKLYIHEEALHIVHSV